MRIEEAASARPGLVTEMGGVDRAQHVAERFEAGAQAGRSLSTSRRIDWRFLLPDPVLSDVLSIEPITRSLADALRVFSSSLTRLNLDAEGSQSQTEPYRLVIACDPSRSTVEQMVSFIRPGGFIYFEVHSPTSLLTGPRHPAHATISSSRSLRWPVTHTQVLSALGFAEIHLHWHWPDFERCKMMVPLDDATAALYALDRGGQGLKARVRRGLGRAVVRSGLLPWMVPCYSVLAQRRVA